MRVPRAVFVFALLICVTSLLAADPPRPPLPPPAALPGPLVIVGGGSMPKDARQAFFDLAGKEKAKIVLIPTASETADDAAKADATRKPWLDLKPQSVVVLHTRDRKRANDPEFVKPLADATGVWFGGGAQTKIVEAYRGTLLEKELRKVHERGGVIGGTSAGASVLSDLMIENGTGTANLGPGLGFLPGFVIDQHFTQRKREGRLVGAVAKNPERVGLGIDESTAVVVKGRMLRVIGNGSATLVAAPGAGKPAAATNLKAGSLLDLFQLRRTAAGRAAKEPFPPAKLREPEVPKGSLVIVGGGGAGPDIWKTFLELAGGPESLIVFVPTANEDPIGFEFPEVNALQRFGAKNVHILHTRDRKTADDPKFSDALTRARGVWFGGGRQWRFVEAYEGTLTEKRFHEVLARGGVIGGSSAGASIQAEYMPRGHPLGNTVMMAEGYERGFGFLPGTAIDQHFFARKRTADMTDLMTAYPQFLGIGLDEGTAIVVKGHTADVIGKSKVAFYDYRDGKPKGEKDYVEVKSGGAYDLKARKAK